MTDGEQIRAERERRGMSQADLAKAIGISQAAIAKIEDGRTARSRYTDAIKRYLGLLVDPVADPGTYRPPPQFLGERDLPVFAAVEGGPGEMVVSTDAIEFVPRPWFLTHVRDGYAVIVTGESMIPVYEPGDMVLVNPKLPALKGKNAIFVGGEESGEFRATVKRLERSTPAEWIVRQWNEPREFALPRRTWPKALRIVGKYEGG